MFQSSRMTLRAELHDSFQQSAQTIASSLNVSLVTAQVLVARGIESVEAAEAFLRPTLREHLEDPMQIRNMEAAIELLLATVDAGEIITIYCDFDVDGVSSGAQLFLFLRALGAQVNYYVPSRFEDGYGLSIEAIEKLLKAGTKLLVTVDCGVSNFKEIEFAKRHGIKVLVVDHHQAETLPPADVVVDPAQEGCPFQKHQLAAAGLVWMLLIALRQVAIRRIPERVIPDPKDFLDLAALGTICDMVPLSGLNRVIASRGVEALERSERPGIVALRNISGIGNNKRLTAGQVSFLLGPRINAIGRMGQAKEAVELLTTTSSERAKKIASVMERANTERKSVESRVLETCLFTLDRNKSLLLEPAIALFGADFHIGVMGIVAQRLVERYHRPTAVMAPATAVVKGSLVPVIKGSVRSISGFSVAEVLHELSPLVLSGGGHHLAGGFTLLPEQREAFEEAFIHAARTRLNEELLRKNWNVDLEVRFSDVDFKLATEFLSLAPFGVGNPSPLLMSREVVIDSVTSLSERDLKIRFSDGGYSLSGVAWKLRGHPHIVKGNKVSIAYSPEINSYQGISSVQLNVKEAWK